VELFHSACPKKMDIKPPQFVRKEALSLSKGTLEMWECEGCRTVVGVWHPDDVLAGLGDTR